MSSELEFLDPKTTLGYGVLRWMEQYLAQPDGENAGGPFVPVEYQAKFIVNFYAIKPNGKYKYRRALLSRVKGLGKSPIMAALCAAELCGPTVFDYFDENGTPVGKQRASALVLIAGVAEASTENTFPLICEMLNQGEAIYEYPELDIGRTRIYYKGSKCHCLTSSSTSNEGARGTFTVMDETALWTPTNGATKFAGTLMRNAAKVKGRVIETTNAYVPGQGSVAEKTHDTAKLIKEGKAKDVGLLLDHIEADSSVDPTDEESLRSGLIELFAEAPWVDVDQDILPLFYDLSIDPLDAERFYLNRVTQATDSWLSSLEWSSCLAEDNPIKFGDTITLGFDGSRGVSKGMSDATALIGCRLSDGRLFELGVWEQPEGPQGVGWSPPVSDIEFTVKEAFEDYNVIGFYCDPNKWESHVANWENKYGAKLKVQVSGSAPCSFWPNQVNRMVRATDSFHNAVLNNDLSHDGSLSLTRHVLNARRRSSKQGVQIAKEHPQSWRKIDAAMAAILAYKARTDALSKGVKDQSKRKPREAHSWS